MMLEVSEQEAWKFLSYLQEKEQEIRLLKAQLESLTRERQITEETVITLLSSVLLPLKQGKKIEAVKALRRNFHLPLMEAKQLVCDGFVPRKP